MTKFITFGVVIDNMGLIAISFVNNLTNNVLAYGYTTQNWYVMGQWFSAWFTLHGTGYLYPNSGSMISKWSTSGAAFGHSVPTSLHGQPQRLKARLCMDHPLILMG
jgi:hypothetical protein